MTCEGLRDRWVITIAGPVRLWRAYYWCAAHHAGCAPFDDALGLWRGYTPALQHMVGIAAALTSFEEAALLLKRMLGISLDKRTVREIALHLAACYERWQQHQQDDPSAIQPDPKAPERLYVEIDAAKAPEPDEWKDVKVGVVFDVAVVNGAQCIGTKTYIAGLEHIAVFTGRFAAHALRRNAAAARLIIALADGAPYNWEMISAIFPNAVQILDIYHAYEHLSTLRHCCWHDDDPLGPAWYRAQKRRLKAGNLNAFFTHFAEVPASTPEQCKTLATTSAYFETNRQRIRYGHFRRCGYFIGSGMVESACKRIVTQRLKLSGARWSTPCAHLVAQLRAAYLNGYLDTFSKYSLAA
jgi:hypothetical protein